MAVKGIITELEQRVERLVGEYRRVAERCRKLTAECDALKARNRDLEENLRETERQLARRELISGLADTGGKEDREKAKARINRLMREVDRCIALLNRE